MSCAVLKDLLPVVDAREGGRQTMGNAARVHAQNGFCAIDGRLEYPAVPGLAATSFAIGGPGRVSLHALAGHVLGRPWMRVVAVTAIPAAFGIQIYRRRQALAADPAPSSSATPAKDGSPQSV